jgi:RNA polymerase sigma-70 factor, ECF subfamily
MQDGDADEALMVQAARGDHRAFRTLMARHMVRAIRIADGIMGSSTDSDDVAQEAFVRVWRGASSFDPAVARFTTWLYRIVVNLAIDRARRPRGEPIENVQDIAADEPSALANIIAKEDASTVTSCISQLPDRQRGGARTLSFRGIKRTRGGSGDGNDREGVRIPVGARPRNIEGAGVGGADSFPEVSMTLDEFKALAEIWGSNIGRWPEHSRSAAETLAGSSEAATILENVGKLDQFIAAAKPHVSSDRVDQAIFNVVTKIADHGHRWTPGGILLPRRWFIPAASIVCAAILGISLGIVTPLETSTHSAALTMVLDAGSFDADWLLR